LREEKSHSVVGQQTTNTALNHLVTFQPVGWKVASFNFPAKLQFSFFRTDSLSSLDIRLKGVPFAEVGSGTPLSCYI